jgi:hypothetical protein
MLSQTYGSREKFRPALVSSIVSSAHKTSLRRRATRCNGDVNISLRLPPSDTPRASGCRAAAKSCLLLPQIRLIALGILGTSLATSMPQQHHIFFIQEVEA